ncbi:D-ala D-ala ligase C-terminus [Cyclonatronum proteinivorum]|uniref:D-ala D-ala ligase C-terminus n=1 Tax=Cyclonatronum proteinivorum TaxID=1457365 RepID=A0A345UJB1_9BACT|nr:ATPase [Cyclonatronum proteinivorum]AXJ00563.1 D-ala D-ala ligase C-terminus [Cyclonatronum proteinivorum]
MSDKQSLTYLCISTYFKGGAFLESCHAEGNTVYLLTAKKLENDPWPRHAVQEFFYLEDEDNSAENIDRILKGFAWLIKEKNIDRVVALDDFDVEKAAAIREEFRIPGMGQTTARYFRDKLAMRLKAQEEGIPVPPFTDLFKDAHINHFADTVKPPYVVKPRSEASAMGIKKVHSKEELWEAVHSLGEERYRFLAEQFKPGDVYHADSLTFDSKVLFCSVSRYLSTPFEVAHGAGIFRSMTCDPKSKETKALVKLNKLVMKGFGMRYSASHTEFIHCHEDGKFYFLETSSRVGGAHLAEMVEFATGINLWREWARVEHASALKMDYKLPEQRKLNGGILVSLARYEHPDQSCFNAPEVQWTIVKKWHVGTIVVSESADRVRELLDEYAGVVQRDFHASAPLPDKATE